MSLLPSSFAAFVLFFLFATPTLVNATRQDTNQSSLKIVVDDSGLMTARVTIVLPDNRQTGLWVVALPFSLKRDEEIKTTVFQPSANNQEARGSEVSEWPLTITKQYTLLATIVPTDAVSLDIEINNFARADVTTDERALIIIDPSIQNIPSIEASAINFPTKDNNYDITFVLPRNYATSSVAVYSNSIRKESNDTDYTISYQDYDHLVDGKPEERQIWISFPNPSRRNFDIASISVGIMFGLFGIQFQPPKWDEKGRVHLAAILSLAIVSIIVVTYFSFVLSNVVPFLSIAAALIVYASYALGYSTYLLVARMYSAKITGNITINGVIPAIAEVKLVRLMNGETKQVEIIKNLQHGGGYSFNVWRTKNCRYRVDVSFENVDQGSDEFDVVPGKEINVPEIALITGNAPKV